MKPISRNTFFFLLTLLLALTHFHRPEIWSRALITYDDVKFIEPLRNMSFTQYFTQWLPTHENYAYPLRDLTYFLDFRLGEIFGFPFFWLSNFFYFSIALYILLMISELVMKRDRLFGYVCIALAALHPVTVEVIQWASIRKHILVALFIAWGTFRVMKLKSENRFPGTREWAEIAGCYVASVLCWPTALLWIFWAFWMFRTELLGNFARILKPALLAFIPVIGFMSFIVFQSRDYKEKLSHSTDPTSIIGSVLFFFESIGRGTFNLVLPIWIAPYYQEHSWKSALGLALLVGFTYLIYNRINGRVKGMAPPSPKTKKNTVVELTEISPTELFTLAFILLLRNSVIFLNSDQMLWADRYLYLLLPYLFLGLGMLFYRPGLLRILMPVALLFTLRGAEAVQYWKTDLELMRHCSYLEGSSRCRILTIEKSFDQMGCQGAYRFIDDFKPVYLSADLKAADPAFRVDFPFYDSFCVATETGVNHEAKEKNLAKLRLDYPQMISSLYFSEVLSLLYEKNPTAAYDKAKETYLLHPELLTGANQKIVNILRGQIEALCILQGNNDHACRDHQNAFLKQVAHIPLEKFQVDWGQGRSLEPFMMGK